MDIESEVEMLSIAVSICEAFRKSYMESTFRIISVSPDFTIRVSYQNNDHSYTLQIHEHNGVSNTHTSLFSLDHINYPRMRTDDIITLNYLDDQDYTNMRTFLNNPKKELHESEMYIDSLTSGGRMMTPEEHFQCSLLHPDLPEYDVIKRFIPIMNQENEVLKNRVVIVHKKENRLSLERIKMIRSALIKEFDTDLEIDLERKL